MTTVLDSESKEEILNENIREEKNSSVQYRKLNGEFFKSDKDFLRIFKESFPSSEQIPTWFLAMRVKQEHITGLGFYDNEKLIGFAYLVEDNHITYVLYLAMDSNLRGKGYGSKCLDIIKNYYPENRILLDIEEVNDKYDNYEQRLKRQKFYMRNGFDEMDYKAAYFSTVFEVYSFRGYVAKEEKTRIIKRLIPKWASIFSFMIKPNYIKTSK